VKWFDRVLQSWRISKVKPFIGDGSRVLDIGCADEAFVNQVPAAGVYVGIDPELERSYTRDKSTFIKGLFPQDLPTDTPPFDAIVMLAVLEHVPADAQVRLARDCFDALSPGGKVLITVPSPATDYVLAVLRTLRIIHGMSLEQHYGFDVGKTPELFTAAGFELMYRRRFQIGFNNLFVFRKPDSDDRQ
jgi:2-polyprenyl-3-methyl-5-hydroxy-6-metoxy-1,4-benzoquinol methylase